MEDSWTYREVAKYTKLSEGTLRKMVRAGKIPCVRAGRAVRFIPDLVRAAWVSLSQAGPVPVSAEVRSCQH